MLKLTRVLGGIFLISTSKIKFRQELSNFKKIVIQKKACVKTYGCQQNASDSEMLAGMLEDMGYLITKNENEADVIVINTCAVRKHAENRIFGNIGALKVLKSKKPDLIIAVCGCMTEQSEEIEKIKNSYSFVDLIFGTHSLSRFPKLLEETIFGKKRVFISNDKNEKILEGVPVKRGSKVKAFVPIMYGCDNFCSYCIVPHVRGRERSRKSKDVVKEVENLLKNGYKEIMLLGQNVNSYGKNLEEEINFAKLLKKIDDFPGEYRIRFMSSHPKDATSELIDTIASSKHISRGIHLPFQCGNNRVLGQMNRKYTRENYLDIINYAREKIENLTLSSDVIVGFPGETYDEFRETITLIKEVNFVSLFTFIYSPRKGTYAASMEDPVEREEKVKWLSELLKVQEQISFQIYENMKGKVFRVLIESKSEKENVLLARTDSNITVEISGSEDLVGKFENIEIMNVSGRTIEGKIV